MTELICGRNAVLETIKSGQTVNRVLIADNIDPAFSASVFKLCKEHGVPCRKLPKQQLQRLAGADQTHRLGLVALQQGKHQRIGADGRPGVALGGDEVGGSDPGRKRQSQQEQQRQKIQSRHGRKP